MKRLVFLIISVSLFVAFFSLRDLDGAMTDYCQVPPYVIQNVAPNVMVVVDNSGSMFGFAYYDRKCSATTTTSCNIDSDCPSGETCSQPDGIDDYRARYGTIGSDTHVWKLGDVVDSTPRIASWIPLNSYYTVYNDQTYKSFTETTE